jgi:hypothetical protein
VSEDSHFAFRDQTLSGAGRELNPTKTTFPLLSQEPRGFWDYVSHSEGEIAM